MARKKKSEQTPPPVGDQPQAAATQASDYDQTPTEQPGAGSSSQEQDLRQQLLRAQADFQNYRRRAEEERTRAAELGTTAIVLRLLPVIDNFERAFKGVPDEVSGTTWHGGIQAIKQQFDGLLTELGIERIESVGQPFNPELHEAIAQEPHPEHPEDIISEEFEAGYRFGESVIRHARVKVSSGKK